jgi:2-succinyl-6-hydroxy-2,4-cyclohexadiene-1-carboxylate synthase
MGGRHALRLALDRPDLVERLVLIGASPGLADTGEREQRRAADDALATHLEQIGVAAFVDEWLAQPIFAGLPVAAQFRDERRTNTAAGLAASLRLAGAGAQESLWDLAEVPRSQRPVWSVSRSQVLGRGESDEEMDFARTSR